MKVSSRRSRIQIGDDDLPVLDPLCGLQAAIAEAYSEVLAHVTAQHASLTGVQQDALGIILERLRFDASWAVTEVKKDPPFKLLRQRYISEAVVARWREVAKRERFTQEDFTLDRDNGRRLTHEHVVQRKGISVGLRATGVAEELHRLLRTAVACVVTVTEDERLRKATGDNWARYTGLKPPIRVYDRLTKSWHTGELSSPMQQSERSEGDSTRLRE